MDASTARRLRLRVGRGVGRAAGARMGHRDVTPIANKQTDEVMAHIIFRRAALFPIVVDMTWWTRVNLGTHD